MQPLQAEESLKLVAALTAASADYKKEARQRILREWEGRLQENGSRPLPQTEAEMRARMAAAGVAYERVKVTA